MHLNPDWEYVADTVMGGISRGQLRIEDVAGEEAARLTGAVTTENNGGFIQMASDLSPDGTGVDLSDYAGLVLRVFGNGEEYDLRLRTDDLTRPWQAYRATFVAPDKWTDITIPFAELEMNKTDIPFDPAKVRRIGVLGYGRDFDADVAVASVSLYR